MPIFGYRLKNYGDALGDKDGVTKSQYYWEQFYKIICCSKHSSDQQTMIGRMIDKHWELGQTFKYIDRARAYGVSVRNHGNDNQFISQVD